MPSQIGSPARQYRSNVLVERKANVEYRSQKEGSSIGKVAVFDCVTRDGIRKTQQEHKYRSNSSLA